MLSLLAPDSRPLSMMSPKAVIAEACACEFLSRKVLLTIIDGTLERLIGGAAIEGPARLAELLRGGAVGAADALPHHEGTADVAAGGGTGATGGETIASDG